MRKFIVIGTVLALGAAAAALRAHEEQAQPATGKVQIVIGKPGDFPAGTVKPLAEQQIIVFADQEGVYAISSRCTHRGCTVSFKKESNMLACPCHGARFDVRGEVTRGPATEDLSWFSVEKNDQGELVVDKDKMVPAGTKFTFSP